MKLKLIFLYCFNKFNTLTNLLFENSLGNESIEVFGFKTVDELGKALDILAREIEKEKGLLSYKY